MYTVRRICEGCGRAFKFPHIAGRFMPEACEVCDPEGHGLLDPMDKYLPLRKVKVPRD